MLNKNIQNKPSNCYNAPSFKSKLNSSLIINSVSSNASGVFYSPRHRVENNKKSPTFLSNRFAMTDPDFSPEIGLKKKASDFIDGFQKKKPVQEPKNTTENLARQKKFHHTASNVSLFNKLKQTASTNPSQVSELKSIPSSPSFFKQKNSSKKNYSTFSECDDFSVHRQQLIDQGPGGLRREQFKFVRKLGQGKFGKVYLGVDKRTGIVVGIKALQKQKIIAENMMEQFIRQLKIQAHLDHPNLIKLYGVCHDKQNIYVVMELGVDGQLYRLMEKGKLSEEATSFVTKSLLQGIAYMHQNAVLHRDIKPENIVMTYGTVKFCDFGWAVNIKNQLRSTFCGTPLYLSPEILIGNSYDQKVDLWAIGVLAYQMLMGQSPFQITSREHLERIITHKVYYPEQDSKDCKTSPEFKTFINSILRKNPKERLNSKQLLKLKFIAQYSEFETCSQLCVPKNTTQ